MKGIFHIDIAVLGQICVKVIAKNCSPGRVMNVLVIFADMLLSLEKLGPVFPSFDPCPYILRRQATMSLTRSEPTYFLKSVDKTKSLGIAGANASFK